MKKIDYYLFLLGVALLCACSSPSEKIKPSQIDAEEAAGNFANATRLIDLFIAENELSPFDIYELNVRKDVMRRIRLDFGKEKTDIDDYIRKYYPELNDEMLTKWEKDGTLEYMIIDGEKRYFNRAAPNLFRLDTDAKARKSEIDKPSGEEKAVLKQCLPEIVNELKNSGKTQASPVKIRVKFKLTLQPNAVPDGETVRCWLPFPREEHRRQSNVKLISANDEHYIISPEQYAHRSIYMEKIAMKDQALEFTVEFSYQQTPEWFDLQNKNILPYDTQSETYKIYTAERPPHIVFSDSIKAISERIVGDETNPWQKAKKIYEWLDAHFPWSGAREYSTLKNIPQYVLENRRGDCGQVTLLFMTLARYNGIPTRWESGLNVQPGGLNIHDWSEFFIEGMGWIPMDQSFGLNNFSDNDDIRFFYVNGIDAYRCVVNNDFSQQLFPSKIYFRSDNVDFQRGELEWRGGNIFYDKWKWEFEASYE